MRIGYQKGPLSLLKARGTLQDKLATLGVNVTWTEFPSGPPQLEALNAGSIDFGDVGEASSRNRGTFRSRAWRSRSAVRASASNP
ncbi:hypothetical protein BamMEX5DRAFT_3787 [Burkholderia ambifaria MEX-5]|uniref:Uncharacterized protein n=1 Tax=Burkholderia ambifaria MEX-5 TaxID=396597 RepID=B1T7M1_9BURK|nr:hypothetical protein BamMEX5DRAFT_3787 [Burkholderia ambifaria MEX-5]